MKRQAPTHIDGRTDSLNAIHVLNRTPIEKLLFSLRTHPILRRRGLRRRRPLKLRLRRLNHARAFKNGRGLPARTLRLRFHMFPHFFLVQVCDRKTLPSCGWASSTGTWAGSGGRGFVRCATARACARGVVRRSNGLGPVRLTAVCAHSAFTELVRVCGSEVRWRSVELSNCWPGGRGSVQYRRPLFEGIRVCMGGRHGRRCRESRSGRDARSVAHERGRELLPTAGLSGGRDIESVTYPPIPDNSVRKKNLEKSRAYLIASTETALKYDIR